MTDRAHADAALDAPFAGRRPVVRDTFERLAAAADGFGRVAVEV